MNFIPQPTSAAPVAAATPVEAPPSHLDEASIWSPDETERTLAAELEKVLMHKPVIRPLALPSVSDTEPVHDPSSDGEDAGFEWQEAGGPNVQSDPIEFSGPAASLKWVANARSDKRRRMLRNAGGWVVTVLVGTAILGGAAFALTGWKPDLTGLVAIVQHAHT